MFSEQEREVLNQMLAIVRSKKAELLSEFSERLEKIESRERALCEDLGEEMPEVSKDTEYLSSILRLKRASLADAATLALRKLGRAATAPEIANHLRAYGYGIDNDRKTLINSLFVTMGRKDDQFIRHPNKTWSLAEWRKDKK